MDLLVCNLLVQESSFLYWLTLGSLAREVMLLVSLFFLETKGWMRYIILWQRWRPKDEVPLCKLNSSFACIMPAKIPLIKASPMDKLRPPNNCKRSMKGVDSGKYEDLKIRYAIFPKLEIRQSLGVSSFQSNSIYMILNLVFSTVKQRMWYLP